MSKRLHTITVWGVIIAMLITIAPPIHHVYASPEDDYIWVVDFWDDTVSITGYKGVSKDIVIPETLDGLTVTRIVYEAFKGQQLSSVIIPDSVTEIERSAFEDNQLTSVTIPNSITEISNSAFANNRLTSVSIPEGVTIIGDTAFEGNQLSNVIIPDSVTKIGSYVFLENQLTEVTIPNSVTEIGYGAFQDNQLESVTISENVTTIKDSAFYKNKLTSVMIPDSVSKIGYGAFSENQLTSITFPQNVTEIQMAAFADNLLTTVTIPNSVTYIGQVAFYGNQLKTVVIHNSAVTIEPGGDQITLPDNTVMVIPEAFDGNQTIPEDLTIIGHVGSTAASYATAHGHTFIDLATLENTLRALQERIDEAKQLLQDATVGDNPGEYAQEAVNDLQAAIEAAEGVLNNLASTEQEVQKASNQLLNDINLFNYYMVTVGDVEPLKLNLLASEGESYKLPDKLKAWLHIVYKDERDGTPKPVTRNEIREVPVIWYSTNPQDPVTTVDISIPGKIYHFKGLVEHYRGDGGIEKEAELTLEVYEAEKPKQVEVGGQQAVKFNNGTMVQGLPADVTIKAAEITANLPNEWDGDELKVTPAGKIMKFALEGVQGPIQMDILIPLDQNADPAKAVIAYFNESEKRWEYVQGSAVVEIDGQRYAKVTVTHNSIYGVLEINARLVANGLQIAHPARNATQLILPEVPQGYAIEIDWSSNEDIIALDGTITPPYQATTVEINLIVYNTLDDDDYEYIEYVEVIVPAKSSTSGGSGGGGGGGSSPATNSREISTSGGTVTLNGVTLTFPANALSGTFKVTVEKVGNTSSLPLEEDMTLASDVFEITKDQAGNFDESITITLPFNKSAVDLEKYDLEVYWLDEEIGEWIKLDNVKIDLEKSVVSGEVDHFTKFAVIATKKEVEVEVTEGIEVAKTPQLSDITGHWAETNIQALVNLGAITGYPDDTFLPNNHMTRAEFVTALVKAFDLETSEGKIFADTANHWAQDTITTAVAHGIVSGYNATYFGLNDYITREQMAVMITRAIHLQANNESVNFTDSANMSPWAIDAISQAVHAEIITGYPDHTFKPQGNATRAEAVTMIMRALVQ